MSGFARRVLTAMQGQTHLFSVGQAGYIVKSKSGQLFGIDLYLSQCVERVEGNIGFKRLLPQILDSSELELDCLVATHRHVDHFDIDAVPQLMSGGKTKLFASVECRKEVKSSIIDENNVTYIKPGDFYTCGDFGLQFINCDHGKGAPDAVGLILMVDEKRILMVGDTCLRLDRVDEYLSRGKINIMIAPINGAYGNLNENECALLSERLKPELTIPSHYGMFALHGGSPGLFYKIMTEQYPKNKFKLMCLGEGITL